MNEMVTIPRVEYDRLRAAAEDLADLQAYDRAKSALEAGDEELIPAEYVNRLLNGDSPLRVYRDLRCLTQAALAQGAGVNRVTVAEIETRWHERLGLVEYAVEDAPQIPDDWDSGTVPLSSLMVFDSLASPQLTASGAAPEG